VLPERYIDEERLLVTVPRLSLADCTVTSAVLA